MSKKTAQRKPARPSGTAPSYATVPVARCLTLRRNPQYVTPADMEGLKASIQRDGFLAPILVRPVAGGRYEVISGNHRLMAARELGLVGIPAVVRRLGDVDATRLAVNLNTIHGDPTPELLAPFLAELDDDLLRTVHLPALVLDDLLEFDDLLGARLHDLQAPPAIDRPSVTAPLPRACVCPTCGSRHGKPSGRKVANV